MKHSETGLNDVQNVRQRILDFCESGKIDEARAALRQAEIERQGIGAIINAEIQYRFGFKL